MAIGHLGVSKQQGIDRPNWVGRGNKMRSGMTWREVLILISSLDCIARPSLQQKSECKGRHGTARDDTRRHETTRDDIIRHGAPRDGIGVGSRETWREDEGGRGIRHMHRWLLSQRRHRRHRVRKIQTGEPCRIES